MTPMHHRWKEVMMESTNSQFMDHLHRRPTAVSLPSSPPENSHKNSSIRKRRKKLNNKRWQSPWLKRSRHGMLYAMLCLGSGISIILYGFRLSSRIYNVKDISEVLQLSENFEQEWPTSGLVHIVNTRFMQDQGHLSTLGMARYHQFITFCLPTMVQQTSQNFFWIVKTDPALDPNILNMMIQAVTPYSNYYLVASNRNFLINKNNGSWRDAAEGWNLIRSKIYTGNITRLHQAIALRNDRSILETRLDADDGLHSMYIEYIQRVAEEKFGKADGSSPMWFYWCLRRHLEWHLPTSPEDIQDSNSNRSGVLIPLQHSALCITPGITVGYNIGTASMSVPVFPHDALYKSLSKKTKDSMSYKYQCYRPGVVPPVEGREPLSDSSHDRKEHLPCLDMAEDFLFGALRSRSWTSAGMRNVEVEQGRLSFDVIQKVWAFVQLKFGISPEVIQVTLEFLQSNKQEIARENLLGQCTAGHSCKSYAKKVLKQYMES